MGFIAPIAANDTALNAINYINPKVIQSMMRPLPSCKSSHCQMNRFQVQMKSNSNDINDSVQCLIEDFSVKERATQVFRSQRGEAVDSTRMLNVSFHSFDKFIRPSHLSHQISVVQRDSHAYAWSSYSAEVM